MAKAIQSFVVEMKNQQLALIKYFNKKILFTLAGLFVFSVGYSQVTYYNSNTSNPIDGTVTTNWTTDPAGGVGSSPVDFAEGDSFIIRTGTTVNTSAPWTISSGATTPGVLEIQGTFSPNFSVNMNGTFSNDGTYTNNGQTVTMGVNGILAGASNSVFDVLTIDAPGSGYVSIDPNNPTTVTIQDGGILNLTNGYFDVGAANTIVLTKSATINVNTGSSDFANLNDGTSLGVNSDGGTIALNGNSGGIITVNGNATFNDITTVGGDGNVRLDLAGTGSLINGTLTIKGGNSNLFAVQGHSPLWGSTSTLFVNNNGQAYTPGLEWVPLSSGYIGTTPGFPNNVTLMNMGTSAGHGAGFDPSGAWSINGVFSVGNGVVPGKASLEDMSLFVCGGITITANSTLRGHDIEDKGNWIRSGSPIGTYTDVGGGTVYFQGTGTPASPQAITVSSGTETSFANIAINNNTYVKLFSPVTIPSTGSVDLLLGIIETSASHLLTVTNTATSALVSGNTISYINGPVQWSLAAGSSNTYVVPTGAGTSGGYLPFTIIPNTPINSATFQAFNVNSGGTPDGTTLAIIDPTAYWKMTTSVALNSGSSVSLGKASPVSPYNRIGESATKAGVYSSIAGTTSTFSINNSTNIGTSSPFFFVMGDTAFIIPVRFVDVNALLQGSNALVQWQVADQDGIVAYSIQKSTDDVHFTSIGQVPATALLNYSFTDMTPAEGINYYRIVSVESSSSVDYSNEVSVVLGGTGTASDVSISPNPITGSSIGIKMSDAIPSGMYTVSLVNSAGQNIYNTSITHTAGKTIETITPTAVLQSGTYYLSLSGTNSIDKYNLKVVVIH